MGNILQLLAPIGLVFHIFFYEPVYNILMLVYHVLGSFALAVIVVTLLLRSVLIPLTRKQLKSTREMQVLQPLLKELQTKHKSEPQRLMEEQRRLYREHGVNPLSGCLPLVVQLPFLYALYFAFGTVLPRVLGHINQDIYPFLPHLTAVPNLAFLWMSLARPDPFHILPVLAGLLTLIQLRMAMPVRKKPAPGVPSDATTQATTTMQYIMPLVTVFIGWQVYSGLALYWTISTAFSAVQQYFISGGWGSLFVGIPGMEHLVPPPKDLPTLAVQRAATNARSAPAAQALAPSRGGFFDRFRQMGAQLRETIAAQQTVRRPPTVPSEDGTSAASMRSTATSGDIAHSNGNGPQAVLGPEPTSNGNATSARPGASTRDRHAQPRGKGPMLVRPEQPTASPAAPDSPLERAIHQGTDTRTPPEHEIARAAAAGPPPPAPNGNGAAPSGNGPASRQAGNQFQLGSGTRKPSAGRGPSSSRRHGGNRARGEK